MASSDRESEIFPLDTNAVLQYISVTWNEDK